jgi:hypothetical protein
MGRLAEIRAAQTAPDAAPAELLPAPEPAKPSRLQRIRAAQAPAPEPIHPRVEAAKLDRQLAQARELQNTESRLTSMAITDALAGSDLFPRAVQEVKDWGAVQTQLAGGPEAPEMRAESGKGEDTHLEAPGALRTFLESGLRPWGAYAMRRAEIAEREAREASPGAPDAEIRRMVAAEMFGSPLRLNTPLRDLEAAPAALGAVWETVKWPFTGERPKSPTSIEAAAELARKYGEPTPPTRGDVAFRAVPRVLAGSMTAVPGRESRFGPRQPRSPEPAVPPTMPAETPTVPGPFGTRLSPEGASGTVLAQALLLPGMDLLPLQAKGATAAAKVGAKGVAAGAKQAAKIPAVAQVVEKAQPTLDAAGRYFIGPPAQAKIIARQAKGQGATVDPGKLERQIATVPYQQNLELRRVAEAEKVMHSVGPAEVDDFFRALELEGPRADIAYMHLSPGARRAVDVYQQLAARHAEAANKTTGMAMRDSYAAHVMTPDAMEAMRGFKPITPPATPPAVVPRPGGFRKERTLPETLTEESGQQIATVPEVNAAINRAQTPAAKAVREQMGPSPFQADPAKNVAQRFVPSAQENVWAETIQKAFAPLARPMNGKVAPKGYAPVPEGSLAAKVLDKAGVPLKGRALPEEAVRVLNEIGKQPEGAAKFFRMVMTPWKASVTTLGGPGYHTRNKLYSVSKRAERWGMLNTLIARDYGTFKSGKGTIQGIPVQRLVEAAKREGTWAGTSEGPAGIIRDIRRSAGLEQGKTAVGRAWSGVKAAGSTVTKPARRLAERVDEGERIRAVIGRLHEPGNRALGSTEERLRDAFQFGRHFITSTAEAPKALDTLSYLFPFIKWQGQEGARAGRMMLTEGAGTLPVKLSEFAEQVVPAKDRIPERYQSRRAREQMALPIGGRDEIGRPRYLGQSWASAGPVTQLFDPVYRVAQMVRGKESPREALQGAAESMMSMLNPIANIGMAQATGVMPASRRPLESLQKAPASLQLVADKWPGLAEALGVEMSPEGQAYAPGTVALPAQSVPWSPYSRFLTATTAEERARALGSMLGVPWFGQDPAMEHMRRRIALEQEEAVQRQRIRKVKGIPSVSR